MLAVMPDPSIPDTDCRSDCDKDTSLSARGPKALEREWAAREILTWCPDSSARESRDLEEPCRRRSCLFCVRRTISALSSAVEFVRPTHLLTVTRLDEDWQPNRARMNRLMRCLRSGGRRLEWFYVIEELAASAGAHAHVLLRGDVPEAEKLHELCARAGFRFPDLQPLDRPRSNASYFFKVAAWTETSLAFHSQLNGGRLFHASRGFWLDPSNGEVLTSERAKSRACAVLPPEARLTDAQVARREHLITQGRAWPRKT